MGLGFASRQKSTSSHPRSAASIRRGTKAIELPVKQHADSFYYLSQIAAHYARLSLAQGLDGGQLAVLLFGDIFKSFPTKRMAILRQFQKEMHWAYRTAIFEGGPLNAKYANVTDARRFDHFF
jgi:hypothetical protein